MWKLFGRLHYDFLVFSISHLFPCQSQNDTEVVSVKSAGDSFHRQWEWMLCLIIKFVRKRLSLAVGS